MLTSHNGHDGSSASWADTLGNGLECPMPFFACGKNEDLALCTQVHPRIFEREELTSAVIQPEEDCLQQLSIDRVDLGINHTTALLQYLLRVMELTDFESLMLAIHSI